MYKLCFVQFRVAKWSSLGIELPTRLTICTPCFTFISTFNYFPFGFLGKVRILIATVPCNFYFSHSSETDYWRYERY